MRKYLNEQQTIQYRQRVLDDTKKYGATKTARLYGINRLTIYDWQKNVLTRTRGSKQSVSWQTNKEIEVVIIEPRLTIDYGPKRFNALPKVLFFHF